MHLNIHSYKQHPELLHQKYDTVIIGSGIGGLTVAAILAKEGKRVLVLERHYTAGGYTHSFKRRGYEWDVGIHYLGEIHRPHTDIANWFSYITDGQMEWADMGAVYDKIIFGKKVYPFYSGKENFISNLQSQFPSASDQQAIEDYVGLLYETTRAARLYFAEKAMPSPVSWAIGGMMRSKYYSLSQKTVYEVLSGLTQNKQLIGVLTGQFGDYGLTPKTASFVIHAMVAKHFLNGACFPVGGCSRIAETIAAVIAKSGGAVLTNAEVSQIKVVNGKATGLIMADGVEIASKMIVSNAGIVNTYQHLLLPEIQNQLGLPDQIEKVKPSVSHIALYLGFKKTAEELGLSKTNLWIYPEDSYDHDENMENYLQNPETAPFPLVYISFPSAKDPDWQNRYPGTATVDIITFAPYEWFEKWEDTRWKKRGMEYDTWKEEMTQRLLKVLFQYVPQLEGQVDYHELSTPLSTKHFVNYQFGELYGIEHSPQRFALRFLKPQTPITNLYLTGQDIASCGIGGAITGGVLTSAVLLKQNLPAIIRKRVKETGLLTAKHSIH